MKVRKIRSGMSASNTNGIKELKRIKSAPNKRPVSYTHLDVYKRQHKILGAQSGSQTTGNGSIDYNDTDYGPNNDGVTDYNDTDYGQNNDGVTDYNDTDYGQNNDGVTDYNDTNYGDTNYDDDGDSDYDD